MGEDGHCAQKIKSCRGTFNLALETNQYSSSRYGLFIAVYTAHKFRWAPHSLEIVENSNLFLMHKPHNHCLYLLSCLGY